ncbi:uroporphyrinogen-III synthase [Candidatus Albibeggiatoa sp. nov. NOAA]|uniref:uroporphyrinogen-III synthase n=1 Tax=Candidatus Albibeggiatoa sp. nov. NOAA TaxID=3162724 RepID=UPI0032F9A618|nr:uroporphyrinogen-III synthase [Thiotrichaceae bacterium]
MQLDGVNVLVTRPKHQAQALCDLIQQHGGHALLLPVLEIIPLSIQQENLPKQIDKAIFISANAVQYSLPYLDKLDIKQLVAIGKKTAEVLQQQTEQAILTASAPYHSEALLQHAELQNLSGQNVVIFRGQGGRDLLANALSQRGANVTYANVYRRQQPNVDTTWLNCEKVDIITVASGESLQNLFSMLKEQQWLTTTPLVAMSQRVTDLAHQYTKQMVYTAPVASDEGLLAALLQWKQSAIS